MTDATAQDRLIYVRWSDDGQHIRKWAREPFAGATAFANAGNGAPLGPLDADDHYPVKDLPFALRSIAENIHVQCAPHVLEDMVRIVTDAANALEDADAAAFRSGSLQPNDGRLFGIDWKDADEVSVSSRGWRQKPGSALRRGVGISLACSAEEKGLVIVVSAARGRAIAAALIDASTEALKR